MTTRRRVPEFAVRRRRQRQRRLLLRRRRRRRQRAGDTTAMGLLPGLDLLTVPPHLGPIYTRVSCVGLFIDARLTRRSTQFLHQLNCTSTH